VAVVAVAAAATTGARGGNTPNLEEILARGRDRFQGGLPGGRWTIIGGGAAALGVFWGRQLGLHRASTPRKSAVKLTLFGKPKSQTVPAEGLHFAALAHRARSSACAAHRKPAPIIGSRRREPFGAVRETA
jgi:hypothetical protein